MNLKEFLKPDWKKIIIFFIIIVPTSAIPNLLYDLGILVGADIGINYGVPFSFYKYGGGPELLPGQPVPVYFNYIPLIEDIIIWYFISCLIVLIYNKCIGKIR